MRNIKLLYNWFSGISSDFVKKDNIGVFIVGQSNAGTDSTAGAQATGATPRTYMPSRLTANLTNVKYGELGGGGTYTVQPWTVSASLTWGWLNQLLFVISLVWTNVAFFKRAIGGTTLRLLVNGGGTFGNGTLGDGRSDFFIRSGVGLDHLISTYGLGNFNLVLIGDHGETNALSSQAIAQELEPALLEFYQQWYTTVLQPRGISLSDVLIMHRKTGKWQVVDFQFVEYSRTSIENAIGATPKARIIKGSNINGGAKSDTLDNTPDNDNSHLNAAGSIMTGNNAATELLAAYGVTRVDSTKPVLQSAVISSGAPNQIVLTYDKTLDSAIPLFWKDFALVVDGTTTRKVTAIAISGSDVTLTLSERIYSNQAVTLSYTKAGYFENVICDEYGNEADEFVISTVGTSPLLVNNSATASPTVTNLYTSNFTNGTAANPDGWASLANATLSKVASSGTESNVMRVTANALGSVTIYRSFTTVNGATYRIRVRVKYPTDFLISGTTSNAIQSSIQQFKSSAPQATTSIASLYQYNRRVVLQEFIDYEFSFVSNSAAQIRFDIANNVTAGQSYDIASVVIDRLG